MSEHDDELGPITQPLMQSRRTWVRGLLLGVTLLVIGGLIGSSLTVIAIKLQRDRDRFEHSRMLQRAVERITSEMALSGEQKSQINAIAALHQEILGEIQREFKKEAQTEMHSMKDEIAKVLTPDQLVHWDKNWSDIMEKSQDRIGDRDRDDRDRDRRDYGESYRERNDEFDEPYDSAKKPNGG